MKIKSIVSILLLGMLSLNAIAQSSTMRNKFAALQEKLSQPYDEYVSTIDREYEEYRDSINKAFADYMEKGGWPKISIKEGEVKPKREEIPPVIYDEGAKDDRAQKDDTTPKDDKAKKDGKKGEATLPVKIIPIIEIPTDTLPVPQPTPIAPIPENDDIKDYAEFTVFGTPMKVRWGDLPQFKLDGDNEKAIARAFRQFTDSEYNNLIRDCLSNRMEYNLCDWAYYKMLQAMTEQACGAGTNEARIAQGILLNQSGYSVRFGYDPENKDMYFLVKTASSPYGMSIAILDGDYFYSLEKVKSRYLNVFNTPYPGEQVFSFDISPLPTFTSQLSDDRTVSSASYSVEATYSVNKNLIDFFATYPASYTKDNIMLQWTSYANTPISQEVKDKLYPKLRKLIEGADQKTAVNMLLNWVQTGFRYETDNVVWGEERSFFAEESLYYPYCDCEDRSILLSHLVRDLLKLDVVLVYYPGHMASAVNFTEEVKGDYLELHGRKFTIADGTYIGAPVGRTMPGMNNEKAKVALLKKDM